MTLLKFVLDKTPKNTVDSQNPPNKWIIEQSNPDDQVQIIIFWAHYEKMFSMWFLKFDTDLMPYNQKRSRPD